MSLLEERVLELLTWVCAIDIEPSTASLFLTISFYLLPPFSYFLLSFVYYFGDSCGYSSDILSKFLFLIALFDAYY